MAKLLCTLDDRIIGEYMLDKERVSIGRKPGNDIVLDNLAVSGTHAYVITIGQDSFLEDANSTNGTSVNSKSVKKHVLSNGDMIEIGRHQFKFLSDNSPSQAPLLNQKTAGSTPLSKAAHTQPPSLQSLIQMSRPMKTEEEKLSEVTPSAISASKTPTAKLKMLNGSNVGKHLSLTKTLTTLGKPNNQVVVITKRDNRYFLSLVEGKKPSVNGQETTALSHLLHHEDILEISGMQMQFIIA
jgi:pSer/pThr/pTyr-binding forkhead associated (FHA) protein